MENLGSAELKAGTRLGEYEIRRRLGVGASAAVYEAVHAESGKHVAIKVLSAELAAVPSARARFLDEAKLTARVRHPHIVEVSDVGEAGGQSYFVMEKLEGEDLAARLARSGPLSVAEAVDILLPVCEAVAEAHRHGITHRDLKPSNIFLAIRDGRQHPVVLDFGVAKDHDANGAAEAGGPTGTASATGAVFGTPYYIAPEHIADHRSAGPASDQYALGVILYECLTGQRPYVGDSIEEVFRTITSGNAPPPSARRTGIPPELEAKVLRAMNSKPAARFPGVGALRDALRPFASTPGTEARAALAPRRAPTSPAIEVEAATPSPFVRTLTPELEALGGPWFSAPEPTDEFADGALGQAASAGPSPALSERRAGEGGAPQHEDSSLVFDSAPHRRWRSGANRKWIGVGAGVALGLVGLVFLATRGSSASGGRPLEVATAPATAPANVPSEAARPLPPASKPAAAESSAVAPSGPPAEKPAAVEASGPRAEKPAAVEASGPRAEKPAAVAASGPPAERPAAIGANRRVPERPAAIAASEAPAEAKLAAVKAPAPKPAAVDRLSRPREMTERPRVREDHGAPVHNGVPLLD